jgi:hypothetical protein
MKKLTLLFLSLFTIGSIQAQNQKSTDMKKKILFVVTSHDKKAVQEKTQDIIWVKFPSLGSSSQCRI